MLRRKIAILVLMMVACHAVYGQAPGMPLVAAPSSSLPKIFIDGDVEWAAPKLNGSYQPKKYDSTFIPRVDLGWNIADDQAIVLSYRYLGADTSTSFNLNVPDAQTDVWRHLRLQNLDLMYRERLGGPSAPLGMDVDMGTRFAYTKIYDQISASTIAGPVETNRELSAFLMGPRLGIRPHWMFDQSSWQMTLYGQVDGSYLLGTFRPRTTVNNEGTYYANDSGTMWNFDAEVGLSFFLIDGMLQLTGGYRYEYWNSSSLGHMTGGDPGTMTMQGPFIRLQLSF